MVWNRRGLAGIFDKIIEIWCWCWYGIADRIRLCNARRSPIEGDLVSIIMPTIGRDATKAIQSVLNQTYKNWELVIIHDGIPHPKSTSIEDGIQFTKDMSWHNLVDGKKIRMFWVKKKLHYPEEPIYHWLVGPVNAINYGLSKVRGAWITRIDDDDKWSKTHLQDMLNWIKRDYPGTEFASAPIETCGQVPITYKFNGVQIGAVQTWLYRSYLKCFKCSKHSWRWRPGNNDVDLPRRMLRAGVKMRYFLLRTQAYVVPRPGLTETGKKGWLQECSKKNPS